MAIMCRPLAVGGGGSVAVGAPWQSSIKTHSPIAGSSVPRFPNGGAISEPSTWNTLGSPPGAE